MRVVLIIFAIFGIVVVAFAVFGGQAAFADTVSELRQKIDDRNAKIQELEKEIGEYQQELTQIGEEKQTLQSAVRTLDVSRKRLATDITLTENRIYSTELQIDELAIEIENIERRISKNTEAVAAAIRAIHVLESDSLVEVLLAHDNLASFWNQVDTLQQFQLTVRDEVKQLAAAKEEREKKKTQSESKKRELTVFTRDLLNQKKVLDISRQEKNTFLEVTKNKESNYQSLLEERIAQREQFERELFEFESQLKIAIDPESFPDPQPGILAPPLGALYITQYFGNTKFATENPQVYGGSGHNGVDFRAAPGTRVRAALSGTVAGVGNTDLQRGCYSYGKWVLIRHNNGLSTLYAHLSHIGVSEGDNLSTGEIVGYSGNTGYSTGPHLHFTVYATQGVKIVKLGDIKEVTNCGNVSIPVADFKAYLNPLSYLPPIS